MAVAETEEQDSAPVRIPVLIIKFRRMPEILGRNSKRASQGHFCASVMGLGRMLRIVGNVN